MLPCFWTVCAGEKVTVCPARSVSPSVPSWTCTLPLSALGMILLAHGVLPMLPERCREGDDMEAQAPEPRIVEHGESS